MNHAGWRPLRTPPPPPGPSLPPWTDQQRSGRRGIIRALSKYHRLRRGQTANSSTPQGGRGGAVGARRAGRSRPLAPHSARFSTRQNLWDASCSGWRGMPCQHAARYGAFRRAHISGSELGEPQQCGNVFEWFSTSKTKSARVYLLHEKHERCRAPLARGHSVNFGLVSTLWAIPQSYRPRRCRSGRVRHIDRNSLGLWQQ
jgi:hypothetical protein